MVSGATHMVTHIATHVATRAATRACFDMRKSSFFVAKAGKVSPGEAKSVRTGRYKCVTALPRYPLQRRDGRRPMG